MHQKKKRAVVCFPADTLDCGLRLKDLGEVDIPLARKQHDEYCAALERLGYFIMRLPPDNRYPDSVFVEDPAVIIEDTLVVTRMQRGARQGEEMALEKILTPLFSKVFTIQPPGCLEGGDRKELKK